jgi:lysophospholipase L1-like esterase
MKKNLLLFFTLFFLLNSMSMAQTKLHQDYLADLKIELKKVWPHNRNINLVFFGHSVPSGYLSGGKVDVMNSYPNKVLYGVTTIFNTATINSIRSTIGGENSNGGIKRFDTEVLGLKPDVLFIDYGLNDRYIGIDIAQSNLESVIVKALSLKIKVILLTPTPDLKEDIKSDSAPLHFMSEMIRTLAAKHSIGLVDSYKIFKDMAMKGVDLKPLMAQNNHINAQGHNLVAEEILKYFNN